MGLTFPKSHLLRSTAEFKRVYDAKRSASDARLVVYALPNDLGHPRLGVSVSKKVGNAVVRNRYKRLFREAFRLSQHDLPACDFVLLPRVGVTATIDQLRESLGKLATEIESARLKT